MTLHHARDVNPAAVPPSPPVTPTAAARRHQPPDWAARALLRDDTAPHQIRYDDPAFWSCTCVPLGEGRYLPLGDASGLTLHQIADAHRAHVEEATRP